MIRVTRGELHWECDYLREAAIQTIYHSKCIVSPDKFYVPKVMQHLSTKEILCTEYVEGVEIDTLKNES
jgi:predicted unusual protein kinase regulating ubiquinone biosynthesis (AarF/ABC1/UbiB family)